METTPQPQIAVLLVGARVVVQVLDLGLGGFDSSRDLGRNQLRVGMFPAVDPDDVTALTRCIDHMLERL